MFLGPKAALILVTVRLITNTVSIQANFITDYWANQAYQKQNFTAAENYYQKQVQANYQDSTALYNLGTAAYQNKNYTEARKCFEQVGATEALVTRKRAEAYFNAGNSSVQLNELEKALEQYKTALKFDPNDQRIKDNYEKLKKILEQQKNSPENNPEKNKPDQKDPKDQAPQENDAQENQDSKDNSEQKNSESKDQAKDQAGDQKPQANQAPQANSEPKSGDPKDQTGDQQPANSTSPEPKSSPESKLDPELKQLMQTAQASDREANKQIMRYQMHQQGGQAQEPEDQGNNW